MGLALTVALPVMAAGYGPFPAYQGSPGQFPATAGVWGAIPTSRNPGQGAIVLGYFLDTDGDRHADVAHVGRPISFATEGIYQLLGAYPSPSNPDVAYILEEPLSGPRYAILVVERVGDTWYRIGSLPIPYHPDLTVLGGGFSFPGTRKFETRWTHLTAFRKGRSGDVLLAVGTYATRGSSVFQSRYALLVDGPDTDPYADHWTESIEIPGVEAITLDDRGNIIARRIESPANPFITSALLRIVDSDGDGLPESIDDTSVASFSWPAPGGGAYGPGDVDLGADRLLITAPILDGANLDSRRRPIPGSIRRHDRYGAPGTLVPYDPPLVFSGRDGYAVAYAHRGADQEWGMAVWDDLDFDGFTDNFLAAPRLEVVPIAMELELPDTEFRSVAVPELHELTIAGAGVDVAFRDFGEFAGGEAFTYSFGGRDYDRMWVGTNGVVSFSGPVSGPASLAALKAQHGVIAAGWSHAWDSSQLRLFAGLAPVQKSFVTGERALAFVVEWRGLRAPGWEADRAVSMRLLLFSDGAYRTDFGSFSELGGMPLVSGYAGPGLHPSESTVDATAHSWGEPFAGTREERVVGEEFGGANPVDLGHVWVRWAGYPERLDPAQPPPKIIKAVLKNGSKIAMTAAGSNILAGARLVVDGGESFALVRSANGKKWVVGKRAASMPGGRTVQQVWADGETLQVVVVNPDGETSDSVPLR